MSPCVRGEAGTSSVWRPVVIVRQLLVACRVLFVCRLPAACCVLFACRLPIACRLSSVAGGVVTSLCRGRVVRRRRRCRPWGGRSPFPSAHASAGLVCYPTVVLGLQTRSVRWEGMTGWPLTLPSAHVTVRDVGAPLVRYRACTVVLGLQTRLVRLGAMTTGGRSPSPAPSHVRGMGAPPVHCPACTFVRCIERRVDEGRR